MDCLWRSKCGRTCADVGTAGSIQCSSRAAPYWKGRERVPKVLDDDAEKAVEGA